MENRPVFVRCNLSKNLTTAHLKNCAAPRISSWLEGRKKKKPVNSRKNDYFPIRIWTSQKGIKEKNWRQIEVPLCCQKEIGLTSLCSAKPLDREHIERI